MGSNNIKIEYIFECRICFCSGSSGAPVLKKFIASNDTEAKRRVENILIPEITKRAEKERGEKVDRLFEKKLFKIIKITVNGK